MSKKLSSRNVKRLLNTLESDGKIFEIVLDNISFYHSCELKPKVETSLNTMYNDYLSLVKKWIGPYTPSGVMNSEHTILIEKVKRISSEYIEDTVDLVRTASYEERKKNISDAEEKEISSSNIKRNSESTNQSIYDEENSSKRRHKPYDAVTLEVETTFENMRITLLTSMLNGTYAPDWIERLLAIFDRKQKSVVSQFMKEYTNFSKQDIISLEHELDIVRKEYIEGIISEVHTMEKIEEARLPSNDSKENHHEGKELRKSWELTHDEERNIRKAQEDLAKKQSDVTRNTSRTILPSDAIK